MSVSTRGLTMVYPGGAGTSLGWDVKFSPRYPLDLQANMGVGEIRLDLRELQISSFKVNLGVGSTTVFLPAYGRYEASIEGAIGQIEVVVPEGLAVRISSDTGLTNVRVPGDFIRAGDVYTSPGYDTAQNRLELVLSQAIGRIVVRYAK
jgi:predicted membrane protein